MVMCNNKNLTTVCLKSGGYLQKSPRPPNMNIVPSMLILDISHKKYETHQLLTVFDCLPWEKVDWQSKERRATWRPMGNSWIWWERGFHSKAHQSTSGFRQILYSLKLKLIAPVRLLLEPKRNVITCSLEPNHFSFKGYVCFREVTLYMFRISAPFNFSTPSCFNPLRFRAGWLKRIRMQFHLVFQMYMCRSNCQIPVFSTV